MEYKHKISVIGGGIFSIVLILKNIVILNVDLNFSVFIEIAFKILALIAGIAISYYLVKLFKRNNDGYSNFKQTFSIVFLVWITGIFISYLFDFVFYNYLFFEHSLELREFTVNKLEEVKDLMSKFGTEEEILSELEEMRETNYYSIYILSESFVFSIPMVAGLCALISLGLKSPKR